MSQGTSMKKYDVADRGFIGYSFVDEYNQQCSIQESSSVIPRLWVGVDVNLKGEKVGERMHINVKQAKAIVKKLNLFIKKGELR